MNPLLFPRGCRVALMLTLCVPAAVAAAPSLAMAAHDGVRSWTPEKGGLD